MSVSLRQQFVGPAAVLLPYLEDPTVTDVLVNGTVALWIERNGELSSVPSPFADGGDLFAVIERLCLPLGRRIDAAVPFLDGRLVDGTRFHVVLPPAATPGPCLSFRRFRPAESAPLESFGDAATCQWLRGLVALRKNVLVCGATGAGKTTLVARLLEDVPPSERIVVVEESRELAPSHPHVVSLEGRPPTPDGVGAVTLRQLLRQALRMRPDRLVLGECRGEEAFELVQALLTGHRGSLGTVHANGCLEALRRVEGLVLSAGTGVPASVVREWVAGAFEAVVFVGRDQGKRTIRETIELCGVESGVYRFRPVRLRASPLLPPQSCAT